MFSLKLVVQLSILEEFVLNLWYLRENLIGFITFKLKILQMFDLADFTYEMDPNSAFNQGSSIFSGPLSLEDPLDSSVNSLRGSHPEVRQSFTLSPPSPLSKRSFQDCNDEESDGAHTIQLQTPLIPAKKRVTK